MCADMQIAILLDHSPLIFPYLSDIMTSQAAELTAFQIRALCVVLGPVCNLRALCV